MVWLKIPDLLPRSLMLVLVSTKRAGSHSTELHPSSHLAAVLACNNSFTSFTSTSCCEWTVSSDWAVHHDASITALWSHRSPLNWILRWQENPTPTNQIMNIKQKKIQRDVMFLLHPAPSPAACKPAPLCFHWLGCHWLCPNVRDMTWPAGICSPSLEASHTHTHTNTQTPITGITHAFATHTPHTPVFWYFSGIHAPCPVVCLL